MKNIQDDSKPAVTILISVETKEKVHWSADTWETGICRPCFSVCDGKKIKIKNWKGAILKHWMHRRVIATKPPPLITSDHLCDLLLTDSFSLVCFPPLLFYTEVQIEKFNSKHVCLALGIKTIAII